LDTDRKATSLIIVSCAALVIVGVALFSQLLVAWIGSSAGFGGFLLDGLSWAAFVLPAYPLVGALIVAMPGFRYDALFALLGSLVPFASLAATARFLDDPARWFSSYPALVHFGAAGLAVAGFGFTCASSLLLLLVARRFRTGPKASGTSAATQARAANLAPGTAAASMFIPKPSLRVQPEAADNNDDGLLLDLSYPDLPPAPFLTSMGNPDPAAPGGPAVEPVPDARLDSAVNAPATEISEISEDPEMLEEFGELVELEGEDEGIEEVEEPIRLMFGRTPTAEGLSGSDPALDADYWADSKPAVITPLDAALAKASDKASDKAPARSTPRSALLPKVEVFHDGEHTDAVREADDLAARSKSFDAAAVTPAATLVKTAGPIEVSVPPAKPVPLPRHRPALEYGLPTEGILTAYPDGQYWIIDDKTRHAAEVLRETLKEFGIAAEVTGIRKGPVITMFEILPAPGVRLSKIAGLSDNIALRLAASSVRIVAPIPGKHAVGIEVPNERRSIVSFKEIVESEVFKNAKMEVPVVLGKDITGDVQVVELTTTPHLLIAGATGSGKSVCVNSIILSILYRRSFNDVKLILIDPKIVELKLYNGIPHLLTPVITEPKRAFQALQYCICEMERRYSLLDSMGVRDIKSFNRKIIEKNMATDKLPYIVVIIDEFADLMATTGKELESTLARLAAMSRAVGIHLVLATQRPSIDVITGLIKANIPSRIAFMVAGKFDSRIIIDMVGAEKLLGRGDMLFSSATDAFPVRMQGAFVSEDEVERVVAHVKTLGTPNYIDEEIFVDDDEDEEGPSLFDTEDDDPLYEKALSIVLEQGKASASFLQRKLKIGYNRAARLVELMEEKGIVGKSQGSKPRDLMHNPEMGSLRPPNPRARYVPDFTADEPEPAQAVEDEEA